MLKQQLESEIDGVTMWQAGEKMQSEFGRTSSATEIQC